MGGSVVACVNSIWNERSKRKDRAITELHKQIDSDLAERARLFDIYKVVYPERVKSAIELMQQADKLFQVAQYAATIGDLTDGKLKAANPRDGMTALSNQITVTLARRCPLHRCEYG